VLDALAARGVRYARALTASPLTLPAHASLLSGLAPAAHGLHDNGLVTLPEEIPTLATALAEEGYTTAAFVGSRVLDRRFGLSRGFAHYDDHLAAEEIGEYGYPERRANAVVDAALLWFRARPSGTPFFLWLHFYDPHAPYDPPSGGATAKARYRGEIAFVDQEIGRLLHGLGQSIEKTLVAVVGDHGEALGEHGERTHGLFLYRSVLEVPLLVAGPGVPQDMVVHQPVPTRRLAATLLERLGFTKHPLPPAVLPGPWTTEEAVEIPIYSETWLPATAYGWSPLEAITLGHWRLIVAPGPELFNFVADPGETENQVVSKRRQARRMKAALENYKKDLDVRTALPTQDAELLADLRRLGYLSDSGGGRAGTLDPKAGLPMLAELDTAKRLLQSGGQREAVEILRKLVRKSPGNVPFLTNLGNALLATGQSEEAIRTLRSAVALNPRLDFLHLQLAEAHRQLGHGAEAEKEYRLATELNPRLAAAWLGLAEGAARRGSGEEEYRLLLQAVDARTLSAPIFLRLGQLEVARGKTTAAADNLQQATKLAPTWPLAWLLRGQVLLSNKDPEAQQCLENVLRLAPGSPAAQQASQLLHGQ